MPYSVILTRKSNKTVRANFKLYNAPTPSCGDIITVDIDGDTVIARVTDIAATQPVDQVSAAEV